MSSILHHLSALGWGWVTLFFVLDVVALTCAAFAVLSRKRKTPVRALLVSAAATLLSGVVGVAAVAAGLSSASSVVGTEDSSDKARVLAEGLSVAMNGTALGILCSGIAAVATLVCAVASLVRGLKPRYSQVPGGLADESH